MTLFSYVLITPARDEAQFIELTLKSVVAQTARPLKWVIVSDGSTDGTDEIVARYAAQHPWIELLQMPGRRERHFAGKALAFNAGYTKMRDLKYEAIGNLDGDISFDEGFFAFLLQKLADDPALGLVGAPFKETSGQTYDYRFTSLENVSGACQLFRRQCLEEIGGYVPVEEGGVDHVALITAKMKGWKTRTFTEKASVHHRKMGTGRHGSLTVWFKQGAKDYAFGNHPVWEILRSFFQMSRRPYVLGGPLVCAGYFWSLLRRKKRPISPETLGFIRLEQKRRLMKIFTRPFSKVKPSLAEEPDEARAWEGVQGPR